MDNHEQICENMGSVVINIFDFFFVFTYKKSNLFTKNNRPLAFFSSNNQTYKFSSEFLQIFFHNAYNNGNLNKIDTDFNKVPTDSTTGEEERNSCNSGDDSSNVRADAWILDVSYVNLPVARGLRQ